MEGKKDPKSFEQSLLDLKVELDTALAEIEKLGGVILKKDQEIKDLERYKTLLDVQKDKYAELDSNWKHRYDELNNNWKYNMDQKNKEIFHLKNSRSKSGTFARIGVGVFTIVMTCFALRLYWTLYGERAEDDGANMIEYTDPKTGKVKKRPETYHEMYERVKKNAEIKAQKWREESIAEAKRKTDEFLQSCGKA